MASDMLRTKFFDASEVLDADKQPFLGLENEVITCSASGRGVLLFGNRTGTIFIISRTFDLTPFQAYDFSIEHLLQLKQHSIMLSVGADEEGIVPVVKVWNTDKLASGAPPQLLRTIRIRHDKPVVSCIAAHENLNYLAIGLADGAVLLCKGDISRERSTNKPPKPLFKSRQPVVGMAFRPVGRAVVLYVATIDEVYVCTLEPHESVELLAGSSGGTVNCCAVSDLEGDFWIADNEELSMYMPEGRGRSLPFKGTKRLLRWYQGYLVVVFTYQQADGAMGGGGRSQTVAVCDPDNKFLAFEQAFDDARHILYEWGSLFVVTGNGKLFQLTEKDFESKKEALFSKNRYEIAINLAKKQQGESSDVLVEIYLRYADYLYRKKSFDDAVRQYIKTIGKLEPSHVIRKFLDSQRIYNLTDYLQALHDKQLADKHHTTLLLNCYTKLKNVAKLDEFIRTDKELNFDLETAITVCRQAGYYEHALFLAKKFDQHDWYLKIQLEDVRNYKDALEYIASLPFRDAKANMEKYGKELVMELPEETTALLKLLCTEYKPSEVRGSTAGRPGGRREKETGPQHADPEAFIHLFVSRLSQLRNFLQYMVAKRNDCSSKVYDTLLELYLRDKEGDARELALREKGIMDLLRDPNAKYDGYQAIVMTQMYDFKPGILYLFEKTKQYQQIVRYYMEKKAFSEVLEACKKYGSADRNLWVQALEFFAADEEGCRLHMKQVLEHLDRSNLLPPLMIIEVLARSPTVMLSAVKDYFSKRLKDENGYIAGDEREIQKYRKQSETMQAEIETLKTEAKLFQDNRCSHCQRPIQLPAVHFLCGHSFHWDCLPAEQDSECSVCQAKHQNVKRMLASHVQTASNHEEFTKQLEGADNRFSVIAAYFGLNLFREDPEVPTQVVQTPRRDVVLAAATPGGAGGYGGGASAVADLSGFSEAEDLLRGSGGGFGRRNIYTSSSGYDY